MCACMHAHTHTHIHTHTQSLWLIWTLTIIPSDLYFVWKEKWEKIIFISCNHQKDNKNEMCCFRREPTKEDRCYVYRLRSIKSKERNLYTGIWTLGVRDALLHMSCVCCYGWTNPCSRIYGTAWFNRAKKITHINSVVNVHCNDKCSWWLGFLSFPPVSLVL